MSTKAVEPKKHSVKASTLFNAFAGVFFMMMVVVIAIEQGVKGFGDYSELGTGVRVATLFAAFLLVMASGRSLLRFSYPYGGLGTVLAFPIGLFIVARCIFGF